MCESVTVFQSVPVRARVGMTCMPMHACISVSHSTNLRRRTYFVHAYNRLLSPRTNHKKKQGWWTKVCPSRRAWQLIRFEPSLGRNEKLPCKEQADYKQTHLLSAHPVPVQTELSGSPCLASRGGRTEADNQSRATTIYHVQRRSLGTADVSIPTPPPPQPLLLRAFHQRFFFFFSSSSPPPPPPPPAACRVVCIVMFRSTSLSGSY